MADVRNATGVLAASELARKADALPEPSVQARGARRFEVIVEQNPGDIARRIAGTASKAAATAFQSEPWLAAWYATIGRTVGDPLLVTALDRNTGELAAMLPLVRRRDTWPRIVEFADASVSDSNAPLLGPAAPANAVEARALWDAVRAALPDADLVRFTKMPAEIEGRANPLVLLPAVRLSSARDHLLVIEGSFEAYIASLRPMLRKQLRKTWRLFTGQEGTSFRRIEDPDEAMRVLAILEREQGARLRARHEPYRLDEPAYSAFYQAITADGVADGSVILTVLMHHDEIVAALLGLARGASYVMTRISADAKGWANRSPGRLIIVETMRMLHAEGFRQFDFSVGEYPYKRRLGARPRPLYDLTAALTARGVPLAAYDRAKQFVRGQPALLALARRIRRPGRKPVDATADDES